MSNLHPKVAVPAVLLLILTAAAAAAAALSDSVPWAAPIASGLALVLQFLSGYSTAGGTTGAAVDLQGLSAPDARQALREAGHP